MSFTHRATTYGRSYGAHLRSGFLHLAAIGAGLAAMVLILLVGSVPGLVSQVNAAETTLYGISTAHHDWVQGELHDTENNGTLVFDQPKPLRLVSATIRHSVELKHSARRTHIR